MASSLVALTDISAMNSTCWSSLSWMMESRVKEALWGSNLKTGDTQGLRVEQLKAGIQGLGGQKPACAEHR